jgi:TPP-dependent pyruvate/acetoin dehydrogenase alpha subunit
MTADASLAKRIYRSLYLIRLVEEEIVQRYWTDCIQSPVHLSIGQEAVAVGVCEALRGDDVVFSTYRSHASYLAKGGNLPAMMAELYGKATGCCGGKGGSMHLIDKQAGVMGTSAIVATTMPLAVGHAYAVRMRGSDSVVISFHGDGAVEEGAFYESLNFAALKRLPIVFVCENNLYAINSPIAERQAGPGIVARAASLGLSAERVGNDVFKILARARSLVARVRAGAGPQFLECETYRWKAHVGPGDDFDLAYRSEAEAASWKDDDQLKAVGALLGRQARSEIESAAALDVAAAVDYAEKSPFPSPADLFADADAEA